MASFRLGFPRFGYCNFWGLFLVALVASAVTVGDCASPWRVPHSELSNKTRSSSPVQSRRQASAGIRAVVGHNASSTTTTGARIHTLAKSRVNRIKSGNDVILPAQQTRDAVEQSTARSVSRNYSITAGNATTNGSTDPTISPITETVLSLPLKVINISFMTVVMIAMVCTVAVYWQSRRAQAVTPPLRHLLEATDDDDLLIDSDDPDESRYNELTFKTDKGTVPALSKFWDFQ